MIVGEAPGADEEREGVPFVGPSGQELNRMLHEVGIMRSECFVTNVCRIRPLGNDISTLIATTKKEITPNHTMLLGKHVLPPIVEGYNLLQHEIAAVKPNVIVAFGNTPLWALTGRWGITKWRGSVLKHSSGAKVIPTYHPAAILRQWDWRVTAMHDLRRAANHRTTAAHTPPQWRFTIRPSLGTVLQAFHTILKRLEASPEGCWIDFDLETRAGHTACAGLSWSLTEAICVPLMCVENKSGFWSEDEEALIVKGLYDILTHPNVRVRGQNLLYDSQYTYRHWHFVPRVAQDTMISHHTMFPGLPKKLDYQASIYCNDYVYWKDDGKEWDKKLGEDQLWSYNCVDCVRTREVGEVELKAIQVMNLAKVEEFQQRMFWPVLQAMLRGVRIDKDARKEMNKTLQFEVDRREEYFLDVLGHKLNPRSSKQMQQLFYDDLKLPVQIKRATGRPTLDDEALDKLSAREPLVRPLIKSIREYRSLGVFLSTFIKAPLDHDERMRCSYNICGTHTYRLSSSENAFGSGTNLQNIPKGVKPEEPEDLELPNIRKIFIPDQGFTFFDLDLSGADAYVVAWEADDQDLKSALRLGLDLHCFNACSIFDIKGIPAEELSKKHPNYPDHLQRIGDDKRQKAKQGVHATNYGGKARTLSTNLGTSVHEADRFIVRWLQAHPGIRRWHERTETLLRAKHYVENRYGYRRVFFDRVEGLLPEALAWIPQSTVGITINKIWLNFYDNMQDNLQVLMQVHDSLAGQFPTHAKDVVLQRMKGESVIVIPYEDPLTIPVGIKTSEVSWGDCA